ncbi:VWA domain-containing protein [Vibrio sp. S4M6]|uniref:vWA domain-containing protein n=1 Tax=Vibrio sinus TaxID=2946865 RepID=UPI00202A343C|nr:VWA domain-containing protein [Vibrio sinus]MCL9780598.1 VWA domain-containing protein [Vibrio sinus]
MTNFELVWWWMLFLLPLPLIVYWLVPAVKKNTAIHLPYLPSQTTQTQPRNLLSKILAGLIWVCLILAAARPVYFGAPITVNPKHRDLMLVVDLSYSMSQKDMKDGNHYISRLAAVKNVLSKFIEERKGDRLGLIFFANHAYLQTPLTFDRNIVAEQLRQVVLKLIGTQTAIGEGIGLATKTFIDNDAPQRVIVLLTDGSNNSGVLGPIEAAKIAHKYHVKIYTVGVGAGEMTVNGFFGQQQINTSADLDEKTLKEIANITGGKYFRAHDNQQLKNIYNTINKLEPVTNASQTWRPQTEWFGLPLAVALLLSAILMILRRNHV